jgi:midasin
MAIWCYSLQSGMGEAEREKLFVVVVGPIAEIDCPLCVGEDENGAPLVVDGWVISALEASRVHQARSVIGSDARDFYGGRQHEPIQPSELRHVAYC